MHPCLNLGTWSKLELSQKHSLPAKERGRYKGSDVEVIIITVTFHCTGEIIYCSGDTEKQEVAGINSSYFPFEHLDKIYWSSPSHTSLRRMSFLILWNTISHSGEEPQLYDQVAHVKNTIIASYSSRTIKLGIMALSSLGMFVLSRTVRDPLSLLLRSLILSKDTAVGVPSLCFPANLVPAN